MVNTTFKALDSFTSVFTVGLPNPRSSLDNAPLLNPDSKARSLNRIARTTLLDFMCLANCWFVVMAETISHNEPVVKKNLNKSLGCCAGSREDITDANGRRIRERQGSRQYSPLPPPLVFLMTKASGRHPRRFFDIAFPAVPSGPFDPDYAPYDGRLGFYDQEACFYRDGSSLSQPAQILGSSH